MGKSESFFTSIQLFSLGSLALIIMRKSKFFCDDVEFCIGRVIMVMRMFVFVLFFLCCTCCFSQESKKDPVNQVGSNTMKGCTLELGETAEFPGGMKALYEYINRSRKNVNCREDGLPKTGKVYVEFTVMKDGSVDSVRV